MLTHFRGHRIIQDYTSKGVGRRSFRKQLLRFSGTPHRLMPLLAHDNNDDNDNSNDKSHKRNDSE